jgi:hypothetical protein
MKKLRGTLAVTLLLVLGLAGCQSVAKGAFKPEQSVKSVQSAAPSVTAVNKVQTSDYLGRWVNHSKEIALYLNKQQTMALFQTDHQTIHGQFKLKLSDNDQATLSQGQLGTAQLTLSNATTMTLKHGKTTIKLMKDTGWNPQHGMIPTSAKVALKASTLATPTPLKPAY